VDVNRLSRGDYAVLAGFVLGIIGVSLSWYAAVDHYTEGTLRYGIHGWAYTLGWLSWVCMLAAALAVVVGSGVFAQLRADLGGKAPLIIMGLGGVATVLVLIGFATKPSADTLGLYLTMHMSSAMLVKAQASSNWNNEVMASGFGAGIILSLIAGVTVTVGGYLKVKDAGIQLLARTAPAAGAAGAPAAAAASSTMPPAPAVPAAPPAAPVVAEGPASEAESASEPEAQAPASKAVPALIRFCGQCGAQFPADDARFCARCGAPRSTGDAGVAQ
jgi:hypothetical protein